MSSAKSSSASTSSKIAESWLKTEEMVVKPIPDFKTAEASFVYLSAEIDAGILSLRTGPFKTYTDQQMVTVWRINTLIRELRVLKDSLHFVCALINEFSWLGLYNRVSTKFAEVEKFNWTQERDQKLLALELQKKTATSN